jgi:hypothetical protein
VILVEYKCLKHELQSTCPPRSSKRESWHQVHVKAGPHFSRPIYTSQRFSTIRMAGSVEQQIHRDPALLYVHAVYEESQRLQLSARLSNAALTINLATGSCSLSRL